jgi:GT2 family glycosyltransferase
VVIVSHRPGDWLAGAVASAAAQADQVIVVDNGSVGSAASAVAAAAGVEVVRAARNRGFAGGFALGRSRARGELIAVLNDDAVAEPGWLEAAAARLADPSVAAVTPKVVLDGWWGEVVVDDEVWYAEGDARPLGRRLLTAEVDGADVLHRLVGAGLHRHESAPGSPDWRWTAGPVPFYVPLGGTGTGRVTLNGEEVAVGAVCRVLNHAGSALTAGGAAVEIGLGAPDDGRLDTARDCFGFSGTAPVWRAETLERIGGLARPFFAYNEDTDWCLRANLAGLRVVYEPAGRVRHRLSATSGGQRNGVVRFLVERNALLALVRNAPVPVAAAEVRRRLARRPPDRVQASLLRLLPWAAGSRAALRRHWRLSPEEVWDRWVDVGYEWDPGPVDLDWVAAHAAGDLWPG